MSQRARISLSGTDPAKVDNVCSQIRGISQKTGVAIRGPVPLPTKTTTPLLHMFLGNIGGAIGETSALALIIGGIYLLIRRVIKWHTPVIYIGTVFLFSLIFKQDVSYALYQVLGGGLIMGAFFMATDYSTSPINDRGKMVFAFGCGLLTCLIRVFGSYPEGVSFAILFMK